MKKYKIWRWLQTRVFCAKKNDERENLGKKKAQESKAFRNSVHPNAYNERKSWVSIFESDCVAFSRDVKATDRFHFAVQLPVGIPSTKMEVGAKAEAVKEI